MSALKEMNQFNCHKIPHWSSVANWVYLAGLGLLKNLEKWPDKPWIAIIDSSISYSKKKVLVILRVSLDFYIKNAGAITLSDVECVGLEIGEVWNYITVKNALEKIFSVVGNPALILKDGGYDLAKGVRFWSKKNPQCYQVSDVGHVVANALKRCYAKNSIFIKLIELINKARARLCQTDFAYLRPPKIRTKGRFQSISRILKWTDNILNFMHGKRTSNPIIIKLREVLPNLIKFKLFVTTLSKDCKICDEFMKELKNNGLNQKTYQSSKTILMSLPEKSIVKEIILNWLNKSIQIQCHLKMKQTPLPVSSDGIESLFGSVKHIIERNPIPEFGKIALVTPLLCGSHSQEKIQKALESVNYKDLKIWEKQNTQNSIRKQKMTFSASSPRSKSGPNLQSSKVA